MIEKRRHQRITCDTKCVVYHEDLKYRGMVENISISGALVSLYRTPPGGIHAGDNCCLLLCDASVSTGSRIPSQVARTISAKIGLKFLIETDKDVSGR